MDTGFGTFLRRAASAIALCAICAATGCTSPDTKADDGIPDRNWNRTRANGLREEDWYGRPRLPETPPPPGFGDDD